MDRELRVVLSARVFSDQKCFGPGVSQLLKRVDELHSLRAIDDEFGVGACGGFEA